MRSSVWRIEYQSDYRYQCVSPSVDLAGGFPFAVRVEQPNKETIAAMPEAERIAQAVKRYSDVEKALRALKE